jgi:hypothetical protein
MNSVVGTALNGLIASSSKLQESASRIVRAGARPTEFLMPEVSESLSAAKAYNASKDSANSSPGGLNSRSSLVSLSAAELGGGNETFSLAEEVVQMKVATQTYKANISVIKTSMEMQDELLNSIGRQKNNV